MLYHSMQQLREPHDGAPAVNGSGDLLLRLRGGDLPSAVALH